jgi:hypothetical protein
MAVLSLKILDRNRNIQSMPQTDSTHKYPVLTSGNIHHIQSQELIERWVDVIKSKARR